MIILDPGHFYEVQDYDRALPCSQFIKFMKRVGENYPGNLTQHAGTNCQELIRVLIDRLKYLNNQIEAFENIECIAKLQSCLKLLEQRAAKRHGLNLRQFNFIEQDIETLPACKTCGHIICNCPL